MNWRLRITLTAVLTLLVSIGVAPLSAQATNWVGWTGNYGCSLASGLNATWSTNYSARLNSLLPQVASATTWGLNNVISPTDMNVTITTSTTVVPSVNYYDADYSTQCGYSFHPATNVVGLTICNSLTSSARCRTHSIYMDNSFTNITDDYTRRCIAIHETGHSLGLAHRSGEVMQGTIPLPTSSFSSHSLAHINGNY
jgi:hypothetical protein